MALFVKDHHVGLNQFSVNADDVVLLSRPLRFGLSRDRRRKSRTEKNEEAAGYRSNVNGAYRANHCLLLRSFIVPLIRSASGAFGSSCKYFSNSSAASLFRWAPK